MKSHIPYTKPSITDLELKYATDAAAHGWGERCYDYLNRFEAGFAEHLGVKYAIATSSCTGALHMGMAGLGIGGGDEVILADSNWIASAAPIVRLGATPVFVDILPDSWCLDPELVEAAITERTRAILAVHLYGNLCDMDRLLGLGRKYGIPVIEDAAEAIGSVYHGQRAGSLGRFGAFSFHGTKTITTGEGGMFVTDDEQLYETVLTLSNHGRARGQAKQFWPDMVGFKYKMSNVQAAIGCGQLERVESLVERKRQILDGYRRNLGGLTRLGLGSRCAVGAAASGDPRRGCGGGGRRQRGCGRGPCRQNQRGQRLPRRPAQLPWRRPGRHTRTLAGAGSGVFHPAAGAEDFRAAPALHLHRQRHAERVSSRPGQRAPQRRGAV